MIVVSESSQLARLWIKGILRVRITWTIKVWVTAIPRAKRFGKGGRKVRRKRVKIPEVLADVEMIYLHERNSLVAPVQCEHDHPLAEIGGIWLRQLALGQALAIHWKNILE